MKCPACFGVLEADGTCSCGYGVKRRYEPPKSMGETCAWSDHGLSCPHRGITSMTTSGQGQWYCREHWDRLNNRKPTATGNASPERPASIGVQEWHAAWKAKFGDRKVLSEAKPNPMESAA